MAGPSLQTIQITLLVLLLSVAAVAALARKLQTPYPVLLVLAGLIFSFIPGMPRVTLDRYSLLCRPTTTSVLRRLEHFVEGFSSKPGHDRVPRNRIGGIHGSERRRGGTVPVSGI
jgi:hypothetical protein